MFVRNVSRSSGRELLVAACAAAFFAVAPVGAALAHGGGGHGGGGHSHSSHSMHASAGDRMRFVPNPGNDANNGGSWSVSDPRCWDGATLLCGAGG